MTLRFPIHRFAQLLTGLVVLFSVLHLTSLLLHNSFNNQVTELLVEKFSFDLERNFPTHFSALILFISSVLFFFIGWSAKHAPVNTGYRYWFGLGLIFLFLSFDEAAHIHEHFDTELIWGAYKTSGYLAWPWVIVYGSLVSMFVIGYLKFWLQMPTFFKYSYLLAGCVYVGSALGFEMLEAFEYSANNSTYTTKYLVFSSIEELFEMSAITFLVYTNMRYIASTFPLTMLSFGQQPLSTHSK